jgi:uncharacterized protein (TIGR03435 family)
LAGQQSASDTFEVATVKQNKSPDRLSGLQRQPGGRLTVTNMTTRTLITFAYQITGYQLVGGPAWIDSDKFDILAKINGNPVWSAPGSGLPDPAQRAMQQLLADRFKLKLHREMRDMDVFALTMVKPGTPGPNLKPSTNDCAAIAEATRRGQPPPSRPSPDAPVPCSMLMGTAGRILFDGYGMPQVANMLIGQVGRIVIDRTNLPGVWQFVLRFSPEQSTDTSEPSIYGALQEQLGLKLGSTKAPFEVTVVDNVEHPVED